MNAALELLLPLAWRNLWRNPRRSALVMVAVAIGLLSIVDFTALMQAWSRSTVTASLRTLTGEGQIHAPGYLGDPCVQHRMAPPSGALLAQLDSGEVKAWAPRVRVPAMARSERASLPVTLVGIDPRREQGLSFIADPLAEGRHLRDADDGGVLIGRKLARRLKTGVGKRIVIMSEAADGRLGERGFRIVGVYPAAERTESTFVFTGLHTGQKMLGIGDAVSEVSFMLRDPSQLDLYLHGLRKAAPSLDVQPWRTLQPLTEAMSRFANSFVGLWLGVMSVLVAFGVVNTLLMAVYERVREFGLLQALGLRPRLIVVEVLLESAFLTACGVLLGAAGAVALIAGFHDGLNLGFLARGAEWLGAGHVLYPQFDWPALLRACLLVWTLGVLASLWPAWRAARRSPVAVLGQG